MPVRFFLTYSLNECKQLRKNRTGITVNKAQLHIRYSYVKSPGSQGEKKYTLRSGLGFGLGAFIYLRAMPLLYRYSGFNFFFYSEEHPPPHIHIKKGGKKLKVTFVRGGEYKWDLHRRSERLTNKDVETIFELLGAKKKDIQKKWKGFFKEGEEITCQEIGKEEISKKVSI